MPQIRPFYIYLGGLILGLAAAAVSIGLIIEEFLGLLIGAGGAATLGWILWNRRLEVIFTPSHPESVRRMLEAARIEPGDVVYDLGCGDGRLLIMAARRYRARGVGIEIDPVLVWTARFLSWLGGVGKQVRIVWADFHHIDVSDADVVFQYLNSDANVKLRPKLGSELSPTARVVSHVHPIPGWEPREVYPSGKAGRYIYLYDSNGWRHDGQ